MQGRASSLANDYSSEFSSQTRNRGGAYYRQRRVTIEESDESSVTAVVRGSTGTYYVDVDFDHGGELAASCECPHFADGAMCKHIWATLLAIDAGVPTDPSRDSRRGSSHRAADDAAAIWDDDDDDEWEEEDEDDWGDGPAIFEALPHGIRQLLDPPYYGARRSSSKPKQGWRSQLAAVIAPAGESRSKTLLLPGSARGREAWFVIDVAECMAARVLIIALYYRERKLNGEFGKIKSLSADRGRLDRFTSREDGEILDELLLVDESYVATATPDDRDYRFGYGHVPRVMSVRPAERFFDRLLPRLCATGRLVWVLGQNQPIETAGHPVGWDDGPPWRFRLRIEPEDKQKRWRLSGELHRSDETGNVTEASPLSRPPLVLPQGVVLFEDRLARLDALDSAGWITALRQTSEIHVPYRDRRQFLQALWQDAVVPTAELPADLCLQPVRLDPLGRLKVHKPHDHRNDRLYAEVAFQYGEHCVPADNPVMARLDEKATQVIVRDRGREQGLLGQLSEAGLQPGDGQWYQPKGTHVWLPARALPDVVARLVADGWNVEAEGFQIRRPGEFKLSVTSGIDWFELDGEFDFDGVTARLPELLAAIRKGESYVQLGDGSKGLLPRDWLAHYGLLADLGETHDGAVRFRPSQALLLDALLAAQQDEQRVSIDQQFRNLRSRLQSFAGVEPRDKPRGFQGELREYQQEGLGWLGFLQEFGFGGCLADDMGLGKTVQVLALLQQRRQRKPDADGGKPPSLAVVPKSLVFNWIDEAARFTPKLKVFGYTGRERFAALENLGDYDLLVTTYGTLRRDITRLKDHRFDFVILDEAQAIKNAGSQNAKACRLLSSPHRLALTGTPVENHLGELWSLFEFLNPGLLGRSKAFQAAARHAGKENGSLELVARSIAPFLLRRTKRQVLTELPDKTEQTLYCDLSGKQLKQYNELRDYYRATLQQKIDDTGLEKSKIHVLEALLRLRQAACHPGLVDKKRDKETSAKLDALREQLAEVLDEGHKALVFSQFTSLLAIVRRQLDRDGVVYEYLDGKTTKRGEKVRRFQEDTDCRLFLISLKAGGHGLNLTAADYVFILDPWWNPAVEAQAVDRAHRIGQNRHVFAYRLIARDTVEERILELQKSKRDLADAIIAADSSLIRNLTAEDLQVLLS